MTPPQKRTKHTHSSNGRNGVTESPGQEDDETLLTKWLPNTNSVNMQANNPTAAKNLVQSHQSYAPLGNGQEDTCGLALFEAENDVTQSSTGDVVTPPPQHQNPAAASALIIVKSGNSTILGD